MSRLFGATSCVLVMMAGAFAAPAPLPKKAKEDALVQRVRKALGAHGYRLHDLRPGKDGEWVLRFTASGDGKPHVVLAISLGTAHLRQPEVVGLLAQLADAESRWAEYKW
jgi:hypothetical protein